MLKRMMMGLLVMASLTIASVGTASANHGHYGGGHHGGGYHGGYGHGGYGHGGGYGYGGHGYGGYAPRVMVAPPVVYAYPPAVGYGYQVQPGCAHSHGYAQPRVGFGLSTPGFGLYIR